MKRELSKEPHELLKKLKTIQKELGTCITLLSQHDKGKEEEHNDDDDSSSLGLIKFQAGGKTFTTNTSTIEQYPDSMLYSMVFGKVSAKKVGDAIFIDNTSKRFGNILEYMRTGKPSIMTYREQQDFKTDLDFYQLPYAEPWSEQESKLRDTLIEWLNWRNRDGFFYVLYDRNENVAHYNYRYTNMDEIYKHYCLFCKSTNTEATTAKKLQNVLKKLDCKIDNELVYGIGKTNVVYSQWKTYHVRFFMHCFTDYQNGFTMIGPRESNILRHFFKWTIWVRLTCVTFFTMALSK